LKIGAIPGHHGDAPAVAHRIDHGGRQIFFSGDMDETGLDKLEKLASGASLLVFNSAVLDPPNAPPFLYRYHSPPADGGRAASTAKVSALLLAHLSPATDLKRQDVEKSIRASFSGRVIFAEDKMTTEP
jgi:ribonuclease BN (tRNA processing enzyme)